MMIKDLMKLSESNSEAFSITTAKGYHITFTKLDPSRDKEFGIFVSTSSNSNTMSRVGTVTVKGISLLRKAFYEV